MGKKVEIKVELPSEEYEKLQLLARNAGMSIDEHLEDAMRMFLQIWRLDESDTSIDTTMNLKSWSL